jgi:unsaturated rhamnogalacturonyl hydrolase
MSENRQVEHQSPISDHKALLDGWLKHQRPDGLFYNLIDYPETLMETNLTKMLAYNVDTGIHDGWLPASDLHTSVLMRSACRSKVDSLGFIQGVRETPLFDRT